MPIANNPSRTLGAIAKRIAPLHLRPADYAALIRPVALDIDRLAFPELVLQERGGALCPLPFGGDVHVPLYRRLVRMKRQQNPGTASPDFASLHPGYGASRYCTHPSPMLKRRKGPMQR
jgi:hypothetical protein